MLNKYWICVIDIYFYYFVIFVRIIILWENNVSVLVLGLISV